MPKPGTEHERLASLAGRRTAEETRHPSSWDAEGGSAGGRARSLLYRSDYMPRPPDAPAEGRWEGDTLTFVSHHQGQTRSSCKWMGVGAVPGASGLLRPPPDAERRRRIPASKSPLRPAGRRRA